MGTNCSPQLVNCLRTVDERFGATKLGATAMDLRPNRVGSTVAVSDAMRILAYAFLLVAIATSVDVHADEPEGDDATERGRVAFQRGLELAEREQWGEALAAFNAAAEARDSAVVQFNIAYCFRALGRYVAAQRAIKRALQSPRGLTGPELEDARGYLAEFEKLVTAVDVVLKPTRAKLSVDGRDLVALDAGGRVWGAGIADAGEGTAISRQKFRVLLDPGVHVFRAARAGHADAVVRHVTRSGTRSSLDLDLARLPATMRVQSLPTGAIVRVDDREVGLSPVEIERQAGRHTIEVVADAYETYAATVDVEAGQRTELTAELEPYSAPLYARWWFWTAAAGVVAAGVIVTWAATRSDPEPRPYDGGSTGWVVQSTAFHF